MLLIFIAQLSFADVMRAVYFIPADVSQPTAVDMGAVRTAMLSSQNFYRDEMIRHGYGEKTFELEKDETGEVVIHIFRGRHNLQVYSNLGMIDQELPVHLRKNRKNPHNLRVIFLKGAKEIEGGAINVSECAGDNCDYTAYIPTENIAFLPFTAHEIGHSFLLQHNRSGSGFLMAPNLIIVNDQPPKLVDFQLSAYEARWLDKHKHFNKGRFDNVSIDIGNDTMLPDGRTYVRWLVEITGTVELHQTQILRQSDGMVIGWDKLCDTEDVAIFRFPRTAVGASELKLEIIDVQGNTSRHSFHVKLPSIPAPVDFANKNENIGDIPKTWASLKVAR